MRFKSLIGILAILLAISVLSNVSFAQDQKEKAETITCPVTGEKVLKSEAVGPYQYNDNEYYFCCSGCLEKFKADPETYLNKTSDLVCGMEIDKRTAKKASFEGKDYYFCSDNCKAEFEKNPKAAIMKAMKTSNTHGMKTKCEDGTDCTDKTGHKAGAKSGCCSDKTKSAKKANPKKI